MSMGCFIGMVVVPRKQTAIRFDEDLLAEVDREAARLGQTRTMFIHRALEAALGQADSDATVLAGTVKPRPKPPSIVGVCRGVGSECGKVNGVHKGSCSRHPRNA